MTERDREILYWHKQRRTSYEIARMTGYSRSVVCGVIFRAQAKGQAERRRESVPRRGRYGDAVKGRKTPEGRYAP